MASRNNSERPIFIEGGRDKEKEGGWENVRPFGPILGREWVFNELEAFIVRYWIPFQLHPLTTISSSRIIGSIRALIYHYTVVCHFPVIEHRVN